MERPSKTFLAACTLLCAFIILTSARSVAAAASPSFDPFCAGKDDSVVPHPTDCHQYLVCCDEEAVNFPCIKPSFESFFPLYSDGLEALLNPETGECDRPGVAPARDCNTTAGTFPGVRTDTAAKICKSVDAYRKTFKGARVGVRDPARFGIEMPMQAEPSAAAGHPSTSDTGKQPAGGGSSQAAPAPASGNSLVLESAADQFGSSNGAGEQVAMLVPPPEEDHNGGGGGRRLLQTTIGAFYRINNPTLGRSSTGIMAIHAALVPRSTKILLWSRQQGPGIAYDPGMSPTPGQGEVSSLFDFETGSFQVTPMRYAPFCSGQSHLSDGTIVVAGGDMPFQYLMDGLKNIRLWREGATQWETLPAMLQDPHWYPTQVQLPDDRTLIIGGFASGAGPPVPSLEVFDYRNSAVTSFNPHPWLAEISPNILYPGTWLLPYVRPNAPAKYLAFGLSCTKGAVLEIDPAPANTVTKILDAPAWTFATACAQYSASGSALLLPLRPSRGYAAELAMFGGVEQFIDSGGGCFCDSPASNKAYRLKLDEASVLGDRAASGWAWQEETMPDRRNLVDSVLLPNGNVFITNGQRYGIPAGGEGGGGQSRDSVFEAWLYRSDAPAGQRFSVLNRTTVARFYHSVAFLLPDGDVWVAGGEQTDCVSGCIYQAPPYPQRISERYKLPYAFSPLYEQRPIIVSTSADAVPMGGLLTVAYNGFVTTAALMAPAAITHQTNMNQRLVELEVVSNAGGSIVLRMPPGGGLIAPPGEYMLFLNNNEIPCRRASWVRLLYAPATYGALMPALSSDFEGGPTPYEARQCCGAAAAFYLASPAVPAASGNTVAQVVVNTPTGVGYNVQLGSASIGLQAGHRYQARAFIRADRPTTIRFTWVNTNGWVPVATLAAVSVNQGWQDIALPTLIPPTDGTYQVQFDMGGAAAGTNFFIDGIQVFDGLAPPRGNVQLPTGPGDMPPAGNPAPLPAAPIAGASTTFEAGSNQPFSGQVLAPAVATINLASGAAPYAGVASAAITVTTPTPAEPWRVQMASAFIPLAAGTTYTFSAYMRATAACTVAFALNSGAPNYANLPGSAQQVNVGAAYALVTLATVTPAAAGQFKAQLDFGACPANSVIYVDNIVAAVGSGAAAGGGGGAGAAPIMAASATFEPGANQPFTGQVIAPAAGTINFASGAAPYAGVASATITVATPTPTEPWRVQLQSGFVSLVAGTSYTVRAWMRASVPAATVGFAWNTAAAPGYANLPGSAQQVTVGAAYALVTLATVTPGISGQYKAFIDLGALPAGATLFIDNIEAVAGTPAPAPAQLAPASATFEPGSNQPFSGQVLAPAAGTINLASATAPFAGAASAAITVTTPTPAEPWRMQLLGGFLPMQAGRTYTLRAQMRATAPGTLVGFSWNSGAPTYANLPGSAQQVAVGVAFTEWVFTVVPAAAGQYRVQLDFAAAGAGVTVFVDNVATTVL